MTITVVALRQQRQEDQDGSMTFAMAVIQKVFSNTLLITLYQDNVIAVQQCCSNTSSIVSQCYPDIMFGLRRRNI